MLPSVPAFSLLVSEEPASLSDDLDHEILVAVGEVVGPERVCGVGYGVAEDDLVQRLAPGVAPGHEDAEIRPGVVEGHVLESDRAYGAAGDIAVDEELPCGLVGQASHGEVVRAAVGQVRPVPAAVH